MQTLHTRFASTAGERALPSLSPQHPLPAHPLRPCSHPHTTTAAPSLHQCIGTSQRQRPLSKHLNVRTCAGFGGFQIGKKQTKECPCGSGETLESCCKPFLESANGTGLVHPPTAEACLRARFTAYKLKYPKFVVKTTHADNPARKGSTSPDGQVKSTLEQDVKVSQQWMQYESLRVLGHRYDEGSAEEVFDIEVDVRQLFELETGKKIKNPPLQTIRQTVRFGLDEGRWQDKGTEDSNWDRQALQPKAA